MSSEMQRRLAKVKKVDNHDASLPDKIEIRERVLEVVGGRVFDAFAGGGTMYAAVWRRAEGYEGCDERRFVDERLMFCADCRRVMRNIELAPFSIFDFDSYGSPWEPCIILAARRKVAPGERIGVVLTEGSGLKLKFGALPGALASLASMREKQPGVSRGGKEIAARAITALARRMNCRVEKTWRAERAQGAAMLYFGVVLLGLSDAAAPAAGCDTPPEGTAAGRASRSARPRAAGRARPS
jgi:hypothetical protein